jgi:hypothetical protein
MRSFKIVLLAASMLSVVSLQAQTIDEVINKYFEALGGKDKVASMKTMHTEFDVEVSGIAASGACWIVNGKAFRNETSFNGQQMIQCYTDTSGWSVNPFMGEMTPTIMTAEQVKAGQGQLDLAGPLFNYAAKGNTVELLGKEPLDGKTAFKLKIKTQAGAEITSWIDATTYYLVKNYIKATVNGSDIQTTMLTSNFKKTDNGYVVPYTMQITVSGLTVDMTNKKVEINKEVDRTIFAMPKQ